MAGGKEATRLGGPVVAAAVGSGAGAGLGVVVAPGAVERLLVVVVVVVHMLVSWAGVVVSRGCS